MTTTLYEGTKRVHAKPMNRGDYNVYRGWEVPADENPSDEGYLVEYVDGGRGNDSRHAGYISWSPKDVFERSYKEVKTVPGLAPHQQRVVDEHAECLERGMKRAHKIQDEALLAGATGREDMRLLCGAATFTVPIEQEIQAKGKTAARVTPADIEANIRAETYFTAFDGFMADDRDMTMQDADALKLLTFCVLVLRNGFTVTGESACASPENFNAEIGRKIARENAVAEVWPLMGYELRSKLAAEKSLAPGLQPIDTAPTDGTVFLGYRERDGRWGECYRIQRDDCEMWGFGGESAAAEEWPGFKPTHWMPLPGKQNQTCVAVVDPAVTGG